MLRVNRQYKGDFIFNFITFLLLGLFSFQSCSLVKIESEQKPLGVKELNTRLLTQKFAQRAMDRIELAADSIIKLAKDDKTTQLNALHWKIITSEELGRISFQTEPKIALMDTWSYFLEVRQAINDSKLELLFGSFNKVAIDAVEDNIVGIQKIAYNVLGSKEYDQIKEFVENYAQNTQLLDQKEFKHQSVRDAYLRFKEIPDSIAVQTVGTLSEVVADASNRLGYWTDASGKRFNWKTELLLKERGIDSMDIEAKIAEVEMQFDRLLEVAENSPETIQQAIIEFRNNISPLFRSLNYEIGDAMQSLSADIQSVDEMIYRERVALDSIIKRERLELTIKADDLVETGIEKAIISVGDTLKDLIIYFILLLLIVFGLPFYIGYFIGKRTNKSS